MVADVYRGLFKFGVFNAVQSSCFDKVSFLLFVGYSCSTARLIALVGEGDEGG